MRWVGTVCGAVAVVLAGSGMAFAASGVVPAVQKFEPEFGKTLPPIGFVRFCATFPQECSHKSSNPKRIAFNGENWSRIVDVNAYVNQRVRPVSDQELYGEPEVWTYPTDKGDCEDYLLLKKKYLESQGFSPESLLITVVLDERGEGHAVLTVVTDDGDYVLDNRRNDILRWTDTGYRYIKRQSPANSQQWVSLSNQDKNLGNKLTSGNPQ